MQYRMAVKAICYLLFLLFDAIVARDIFICNDNSDVEVKQCINFLELLAYTVRSNDTIKIEPGTYNLLKANTAAYSMVIRDVVNVTLTGYTDNSSNMESVAAIKCSIKLGFTFINVSNVQLSNLCFIGCGAPITIETAEEVLQVQTNSFYSIPDGVHATLLFANVFSLVMDNVNVSGSYGFGMLAVNVLGETSISQVTFREKNYYAQQVVHNGNPDSKNINFADVCSAVYGSAVLCIGGNIMILFQEVVHCVDATHLEISETFILDGIDIIGRVVQNVTLLSASGLGIVLGHVSYSISIIIAESVFDGNVAPQGASLSILVYNTEATFQLQILKVTISNANPLALSKLRGDVGAEREVGFTIKLD